MDSAADYKVLLAAWYRAADPNLTQEEIGRRAELGVQGQVSRLISEARSKGYLREVFQFPPHTSPDERRQLQRRFEQSFYKHHEDLEARLIQRAETLCSTRSEGGSPFKRLHVVAAPGLDGDARTREDAFQAFGASAAEIVSQYIDDAESCSVAWGRTIDATVRQIRSRAKPPGRKKRFIPIAGEPTNFEPNGVSPSDAASILAAAWPQSEQLSLRGVQARIPRSVYERDREGIARQLANYSKSYKRIFGRPGALMDQVAMILTGIGDVGTSKRASESTTQPDPWYQETAEAEEESVLRLAVGNIGGVWIARDDASAEDRRKVDQVNERWLGAQHADFRRCSLNAVMPHRPGVVVLAVEPAKAGIVLEALYLVNVLIISTQLADALVRALGTAGP